MSTFKENNASFDYARILAAVGIVWFHCAAPGALVGYSGLAFFLLLLVHLTVHQAVAARDRKHRAPPFWRFAASRAERLLVPWAIASCLYGILKLGEVSLGTPFAFEFTISMWLTGPALHLWFLPFAFAVSIIVWPLVRHLALARQSTIPPVSFLSAGLGLVMLSLTQENTFLIPLAQWAYALPAVLIGLALACAPATAQTQIGLMAAFICAALAANWTDGLFEIFLACSVLILCRFVQLPATGFSRTAAQMALLIYLVHPAIMSAVTRTGIVETGTAAFALMVLILTIGSIMLWRYAAPHIQRAFMPSLPRYGRNFQGG